MKKLYKLIAKGEHFYTKTMLDRPEVIPGKGRVEVLAWEKFEKVSGTQARCIDASASWNNRRMIGHMYPFSSNQTVLTSIE